MLPAGSQSGRVAAAGALPQAADGAPRTLFRDLILVYGVSALDVALSVLANVIVPMAASKVAFADYRMVLLYTSYAGFSHAGLLSGMYLAVVGKTTDQLDWSLLRAVKSALIVTQALLALLLIALTTTTLAGTPGAWIGPVSVACWGALNLTTFYNYLHQGTGNFALFFRVNVAVKVAAIAGVSLVALLGAATSRSLVLVFVIPVLATPLIYEYLWRHNKLVGQGPPVRGRWPELLRLWRQGALLHLANASLALVFTAGTLIVSLMFSREVFATYAFASGLVSVLYFVVDGLTAAATPSLARTQRTAGSTDASFALYAALIWFVPVAYWALAVGVTRWVPAYADSVPLLLVFCTSLPLSLIVRSRVVAVATAAGRQRELLTLGLCSLGATLAAVLVSYGFGRSAYAVGTGWTAAIVAIGCSSVLLNRGGNESTRSNEDWLAGYAVAATALFLICVLSLQTPLVSVIYLIGASVGFTHALRRRQPRGTPA